MKKKRERTARGNGVIDGGPAWHAAKETYHDALYAILLEDMERELRNPRIREKVLRALRELNQVLLEALLERS